METFNIINNIEEGVLNNTPTNYDSIEKTNNPVDDILLLNHPSQEKNIEVGKPENTTPAKKKKNRGDILKLNKEVMKKQKNFSMSDEVIKLLKDQCIYFHKNLSDTLETIIRNSAEEIKKKKNNSAVIKSNDNEELIKQQAQFIEQLFDEVEKLKNGTPIQVAYDSENTNPEIEKLANEITYLKKQLAELDNNFKSNKAKHFCSMKNVGATFQSLETEIVKKYEVVEKKEDNGTIKYEVEKIKQAEGGE